MISPRPCKTAHRRSELSRSSPHAFPTTSTSSDLVYRRERVFFMRSEPILLPSIKFLGPLSTASYCSLEQTLIPVGRQRRIGQNTSDPSFSARLVQYQIAASGRRSEGGKEVEETVPIRYSELDLQRQVQLRELIRAARIAFGWKSDTETSNQRPSLE